MTTRSPIDMSVYWYICVSRLKPFPSIAPKRGLCCTSWSKLTIKRMWILVNGLMPFSVTVPLWIVSIISWYRLKYQWKTDWPTLLCLKLVKNQVVPDVFEDFIDPDNFSDGSWTSTFLIFLHKLVQNFIFEKPSLLFLMRLSIVGRNKCRFKERKRLG